jgi:hypothetical protein
MQRSGERVGIGNGGVGRGCEGVGNVCWVQTMGTGIVGESYG